MRARERQNITMLQSLVDTVLETIVDGVITINRKGEIQSFNKACVKLFGYELDDVLGKNVSMLMPEPYQSQHDTYISNYLETHVPKIIGIGREVSGRRKDGSVFPMELAVGESLHGGGHVFVGIIRDITDRHEAEKEREQLRQAQKMEALGQLTGGIAHDFNNILAVILGNLDFLLEKVGDNKDLTRYIMPSIEAAERGSDLTQRLLAFGRKQTLQPQLISVSDLIANLCKIVGRTLGERIEISTIMDGDLWSVKIDPRQMENALLNLSINARDAMPHGGKIIYEAKNVHLDEEYADQFLDVVDGDYVMISISDTGSGMSPEVISKAFDPFFTTKDVGKGSGLGLSMVYGFVKQSSGHIKLYSEPGFGTTVKIYLPRAEDPDQVIVFRTAEDAIVPPTNARNYKVLVVEDNKDVLKLTSSIVESLGYTVITAETGDQALTIFENMGDEIDLLISDVMLPGTINGPILAKRASEMFPKLKVLFNSGYAEHAIFEAGLLEKDVHLIGKPFRKNQLAKKIIEVLQG